MLELRLRLLSRKDTTKKQMKHSNSHKTLKKARFKVKKTDKAGYG